MYYCKQCATPIEEGVEKCPKCGAKPGRGKRFCAFCGNKQLLDSKTCPHCQKTYDDMSFIPVSTEDKVTVPSDTLPIVENPRTPIDISKNPLLEAIARNSKGEEERTAVFVEYIQKGIEESEAYEQEPVTTRQNEGKPTAKKVATGNAIPRPQEKVTVSDTTHPEVKVSTSVNKPTVPAKPAEKTNEPNIPARAPKEAVVSAEVPVAGSQGSAPIPREIRIPEPKVLVQETMPKREEKVQEIKPAETQNAPAEAVSATQAAFPNAFQKTPAPMPDIRKVTEPIPVQNIRKERKSVGFDFCSGFAIAGIILCILSVLTRVDTNLFYGVGTGVVFSLLGFFGNKKYFSVAGLILASAVAVIYGIL